MFSNGYRYIYHYHIRKCGGTSLNSWLSWHCPDWRRYQKPLVDYFFDADDDTSAEIFFPTQYQTPVANTHASLMGRIRPHTFTLTMLRNPTARLISQVADWRRESAMNHVVRPLARLAFADAARLSLKDILEKHTISALSPMVENHQVRALASDSVKRPFRAGTSSDRLAMALEALEAKFDLVGLTERMAETRSVLCRRLGLVPAVEAGGRRNVINASNITPDEIADAKGILEELTENDWILYRRAVSLFEERHAVEASFSEAMFEDGHAIDAVDRLAPMARGSGIAVGVDDALLANGIHGRDGSGTDHQSVWTGPENRSVLYFPAPQDEKLTVKLWIRGYASADMRAQLRFEIDDVPVNHRFCQEPGYADVAEIDITSARPFIKLTIRVDATVPHDLDRRLRGVAFDAYGWSVPTGETSNRMNIVEQTGEDMPVENVAYFTALKDRIASTASPGEVMQHVRYLADKAALSVEQLLSGQDFSVDEQVLADARTNIEAVLAAQQPPAAEPVTAADPAVFTALAARIVQATPEIRAQAMLHVEYLADKAGMTGSDILSGAPFAAHPQHMEDALQNIEATLDPAGAATVKQESIDDIVSAAEHVLQGWCDHEKAMAIVDLILTERPEICVEIGVYGGRSLIPAAAALRQNGSGAVYGIETWRTDVATQHATNERNDDWWRNIDFHAIKTGLYSFIVDHDLASQVRIVEAPSADAASLFGSIDYLHIDGAHSIYNAAEDVVLYAKKVKSGGIIIMDDAGWHTTAPAVAILDSLGERIQVFKNENGVDACIVYRKH
jgi:predicted O-methyltransferase YrrM